MFKLVIIDFNRTLYDPIEKKLFKGSSELLGYFKKHSLTTVVYSTESKNKYEQIQNCIAELVADIKLTKKKLASDIESIMKSHLASTSETLVIGDDPEAELCFGSKMSIPTVAVGTGFCTEEDAAGLGIHFIKSVDALKSLLAENQL